MSSPSDDLPRVGAAATEPAQWWPDENGPSTRPRPQGRETTTAQEEIQRFKRVPVVGRLPWRRQYLVAIIGLIVGILFMIQQAVTQAQADQSQATRMGAALGLHQALAHLAHQEDAVRGAGAVDPVALTAALSQGSAATQRLADPALTTAWTTLQQAAQAMPEQGRDQQARLQQTQQQLTVINRALPALRSATAALQDPTASALMESWEQLQRALQQAVTQGQPPAASAAADQARLEAQLRTFYASAAAQQADARKQVWDQHLALFNQTQAPLSQVFATPAQASALHAPLRAINDRLDALDVTQGGSHSRVGVWMAAMFAALCLGLLTFISAKQQQLATLEARVAGERLEGVVFDLIQQQGQIGQGNLTALSRVDDPIVGPLSEGINQTVQELRSLVRRVRATGDNTTTVAEGVVRIIHELTADSQAQVAALNANGQDVLRLSQTLQELTRQAGQARTQTDQTLTTTREGSEVVEQSRQALGQLRARHEDSAARTRRVADALREAAALTQLAVDQAERMEELAIQAALHAERSGEQGQGFRVVARTMRMLAEETKQPAERIHALVEATQAELDGVQGVLRSGIEQTDDAHRLADLAFDAWEQVQARLQSLQERIIALAETASDQAPVAQGLATRTHDSLDQGQRSQQRAQEAAQAIAPLLAAVHDLDDSIKRFQV